eukprot:1958230-Amphidinium_carterae.1
MSEKSAVRQVPIIFFRSSGVWVVRDPARWVPRTFACEGSFFTTRGLRTREVHTTPTGFHEKPNPHTPKCRKRVHTQKNQPSWRVLWFHLLKADSEHSISCVALLLLLLFSSGIVYFVAAELTSRRGTEVSCGYCLLCRPTHLSEVSYKNLLHCVWDLSEYF